MQTIYSRLRQAFPFVTQRPATEDDFFGFCADRNIGVVFHPDIDHGIYAVSRGRHFIFLSTRLRGPLLLYVMFHELGHYLFHVPRRTRNAAFGFTGCRDHAEAEAAAAYLLLPAGDLERALLDGSFAENERLASLIGTRLELLRTYGR